MLVEAWVERGERRGGNMGGTSGVDDDSVLFLDVDAGYTGILGSVKISSCVITAFDLPVQFTFYIIIFLKESIRSIMRKL